MRVFIGIEFDTSVKEYLYKLQNVLKPVVLKGDFTLFNNFHLTLKYIGHIDEDELEIIKEMIDDISVNHTPFSVKLNGLQSFRKGNGDILFVSIEQGKKELNSLFHDFEDMSVYQGFDESTHKKFRPHITISKKTTMKNRELYDVLPVYFYEIPISKITLFHSHRINNILTYTPIYQKELKE